ncbi:MAG: 30S ribosome-binding factor RbfA [Myxococcota bacterium]
MPGDRKRGQRLGQLLQQEIASLLVNEVKDPRVGFATVTEVRTAADLTLARVFVSILGDDAQRDATLEGLHKARGYLRRELAHRLRLRQMPELQFELDTTLDTADRLESVFKAINEGKTEAEHTSGPEEFVAPETIRTDFAKAEEEAVSEEKPRSGRTGRSKRGGSRRSRKTNGRRR